MGTIRQISFLYDVNLDTALDLGKFSLYPYRLIRQEIDLDIRTHLDTLFQHFRNSQNNPLERITLICPRSNFKLEPLSNSDTERMRSEIGAVFISSLIRNSAMDSVTSENFEIITHDVTPPIKTFTTIDGSYVSIKRICDLKDTGIRLPRYFCEPLLPLHPEIDLLTGCIACFDLNPALGSRIAQAIRWVSYSYTNVNSFPYHNRILQLMIAFEILADNSRGFTQDTFAEWLDQTWEIDSTKKYKNNAVWAKDKELHGAVGWWGIEYYQMRNRIIHDANPNALVFHDSLGREYFGTGILVFLECLRALLQREKLITPSGNENFFRHIILRPTTHEKEL